MIRVYVKKQSNYPVKSTFVRKILQDFLRKSGIVSDSLVYVSFVNEKTVKKIASKYLGEKNQIHEVLSFGESEIRGEFRYPQSRFINLGEIVLCYPKIVEMARRENRLIDEKVRELLEHGAMHLIGKHHD